MQTVREIDKYIRSCLLQFQRREGMLRTFFAMSRNRGSRREYVERNLIGRVVIIIREYSNSR